jgi:hypothetical protein
MGTPEIQKRGIYGMWRVRPGAKSLSTGWNGYHGHAGRARRLDARGRVLECQALCWQDAHAAGGST